MRDRREKSSVLPGPNDRGNDLVEFCWPAWPAGETQMDVIEKDLVLLVDGTGQGRIMEKRHFGIPVSLYGRAPGRKLSSSGGGIGGFVFSGDPNWDQLEVSC